MRRRAARGGRATPPLHSDDNDGEEGRTGEGDAGHDQDPTHSGAGVSKDSPGGENSSAGASSDGGLANHTIQNSDTVVVGGANDDHSDITDVDDRVNNHNNSALNRLSMDAYGSSDED